MSKISELSNGGALLSTDDLIVVRSGGNVRAQLSAISGQSVSATTLAASGATTLSSTLAVTGTATMGGLAVDGDGLHFAVTGSPVGSIGGGAGFLAIGSGTGNLIFADALVAPASNSAGGASNGVVDLGSTTRRYKNVYRSGSTISTSDRNMKQDIRDLTDAERNVAVAAKNLLKAFRFIDRVEEEGDSANIHFGIIAQDLAAAFTAEGLYANDYQVYRADTFTDDDGNEQTRLGICYENLLAFIISAI